MDGLMMIDSGEVMAVAEQLGKAYVKAVTYYLKECGLPPDRALSEAAQSDPPGVIERLMRVPPKELGWRELQKIAASNATGAAQRWIELHDAARSELSSGMRAAQPLEGTPYQQAQFLELRQSFIQEWLPSGGVELALVGALAQTYTMYLYWLGRHSTQASLDCDSEMLEQSAAMADRWNRLFMRTLRNLRDLRRMGVVIKAGQVNIASEGSKQMNVQHLAQRAEIAGEGFNNRELGGCDGEQ